MSIEGLGETALRFNLPMDRVEVTVKVGPASFEVAGRLDGVFVWADASKVVITQRARFRYPIRPREIRSATVSMRASDAEAEGRRER